MAAKGTKLDERELVILAAIFGRSNMGMGLPPKRDVEGLKALTDRRTKKPMIPALEECVADLCGKFMESDHHERVFEEEARSWLKELRRDTAENVARVHPDIAELYWRDPATYVDDEKFPNG